MIKGRLDDRGQLSAEYLLLLVVILAILSIVTIPLVDQSIKASDDVSDVSAASNVVNSISNAANIVYANGPGAKRTLQVYIPTNMKIVVSGKTISTNITLSNGSVKTVSATTNYPLISHNFTVSKGNKIAVLAWTGGGSYISNYVGT